MNVKGHFVTFVVEAAICMLASTVLHAQPPYASVVAFESVMKNAGRPCKLVGYDGAGHGFFNSKEYFARTLAEADGFLVDLGWIKK